MNKTVKALLFCVLFSALEVTAKGYSPHMITFFFNSYPTVNNELHKAQSKKSGIFVSYFGYLTKSNDIGEIMFPRKHQNTSFSLLVCNDIEPVFMLQNTIHHWQVKDKAKYAFYTLSRHQDKQTKLYFWNVEKADLPKNKHLPLDTIAIVAEPHQIYVPEGITLTNNNPQLALPPLYAKEGANSAKNSLVGLSLRTFFDPIDRVYKAEKDKMQSQTNTF